MIGKLIILPIIISGIISIIKEEYIKKIGIIGSIIVYIYSIIIILKYDSNIGGFQLIESYIWSEQYNIKLILGIDGISLSLIILTTFIIPFCILISWNTIKKYIRLYMIILFILETILILVFTVIDIIYFYIFYEAILIPMYMIIGIWGSRERKIKAAYQFFLYTLLGSILMLIGIFIIYLEFGTTDYIIIKALAKELTINKQKILWVLFVISLAVKIPMIPVHIWLPEAHVEAPTAGSVILAGILLKLGTYGMLRFLIPLFPIASIYYSPIIIIISVISIVYASLTTIRQIDLKKIIAYASIGHMNMVTLGIYTFNIEAIQGGIYMMISHGIVSSGLFLGIGVLYDRYKTRILKYYRGLIKVMPLFGILYFILILGNISVPGTSSFIAELLIIIGAYQRNTIITILAATTVIWSAIYSIWFYNRLMYGEITPYIKKFNDITYREGMTLFPFIFLTILLGLYPNWIIESMNQIITIMLRNY